VLVGRDGPVIGALVWFLICIRRRSGPDSLSPTTFFPPRLPSPVFFPRPPPNQRCVQIAFTVPSAGRIGFPLYGAGAFPPTRGFGSRTRAAVFLAVLGLVLLSAFVDCVALTVFGVGCPFILWLIGSSSFPPPRLARRSLPSPGSFRGVSGSHSCRFQAHEQGSRCSFLAGARFEANQPSSFIR